MMEMIRKSIEVGAFIEDGTCFYKIYAYQGHVFCFNFVTESITEATAADIATATEFMLNHPDLF